MNDTKSLSQTEHSRILANDLRMKQSVRTTFKLSEETISLLGLIATQLGIKKKSLLDQLIKDVGLLDQLAEDAHQVDTEKNRYAKTYVISRSTLQSINKVAKGRNIPRDALVEVSVKRLWPVIEDELQKHTKRKEILKKMKESLQQGEELLLNAEEMFGRRDEVYEMLEKQVRLTQKNVEILMAAIQKGRPMEKL